MINRGLVELMANSRRRACYEAGQEQVKTADVKRQIVKLFENGESLADIA